mmetsp:Transcript_67373/g.161567  ORF Transcript_67373/g.161567 Transcript_67373/m.161567 type:complete len:943 (+) Transcript_67373:35-2863(+)
MGCNNSAEGEVHTVQVVPAAAPEGRAPPPALKAGMGETKTVTVLPSQVESAETARAAAEADRTTKSQPSQAGAAGPNLKAFPLPEGWQVVFRLSESDVRARWGARPRPRPAPEGSRTPAIGSSFEAEVIVPEAASPLRVPLQLLPQWIEPMVEKPPFLGRYKVVREMSSSSSSQGRVLEAFDTVERVPRALQVRETMTEVDVRVFGQRLQLEALDKDDKSFMRLREVFLALPGRVAVIEDLRGPTLWEEFSSLTPGQDLQLAIANVANAVLRGLSHLHSAGWAHCGVSPESVCRCSSGTWKLGSLETGRRSEDLRASQQLIRTGTAFPPEALLGMVQSEKVDLWQLAASLCESVTRQRLDAIGRAAGIEPDVLVAEKLCRLVDFLGPLPAALLERHPHREELFTPEGHILRPSTPAPDGSVALQAIEPCSAASTQSGQVVRPPRLVQHLGTSPGATSIIEFIGWLLQPDPDQRPSCDEALDHQFLRPGPGSPNSNAKKRGVNFGLRDGAAKPPAKDADARGVQIQDSRGDNENGIKRKGTGFVNISDLPASDSEEEEQPKPPSKQTPKSKPAPKQASRKLVTPQQPELERGTSQVQIQDKAGDNESTIRRKGTGFVQLSDLPPSDEEDEDEEAENPANKVRIEETQRQPSNSIVRKGTGFVNIGDLPPSDSEDEDGDGKGVTFDSASSQGKNNIQRKGTGFVQMADLPPSDEEDEDDDEVQGKPKKMHVAIQDTHGDNENKIRRKGTGFVNLSDLPPSDDEDEEEAGDDSSKKAVQINDGGGGDGKKIPRKGTGFVRNDELPTGSDLEDDGDDPPLPSHVTIQDTHGDNENTISRKGTGFVRLSDLPQSDDEDDDDEEEMPKAQRAAEDVEEGRSPNSGKRVQIQDPNSQKGGVGLTASGSTQGSATGDDSPKTPQRGFARKGTGIVRKSDIPDSSDEEEDD